MLRPRISFHFCYWKESPFSENTKQPETTVHFSDHFPIFFSSRLLLSILTLKLRTTVAYCAIITAFTLWARDTAFRDITVQQRQTRCYWDSYRGRPTHQKDKPSAFESLGAVLQEQSSSGSQWRRLHPLLPSLPCYIWIFPPCSSNSSPRINRVL